MKFGSSSSTRIAASTASTALPAPASTPAPASSARFNAARTPTSVAGEIVLAGDTFYDFESKYLGAPGADLVCPADLAPGDLTEMQRLAALAFEAIDGTGLARVDFFLTEDGWVVNEVNTMPGFTPISMFPACWLASGLSYPELIDELIALGLETER